MIFWPSPRHKIRARPGSRSQFRDLAKIRIRERGLERKIPKSAPPRKRSRKARAGVAGAKTAYIPDINRLRAPQLPRLACPSWFATFGEFGIHLTTHSGISASVALPSATSCNCRSGASNISSHLKKKSPWPSTKLQQARTHQKLINVAAQVAQLRRKASASPQSSHSRCGADFRCKACPAANYEAKAELLQANLGYLLAWAELQRTAASSGTRNTINLA